MSTDSLAALRKSLGPDLAALAEDHMQQDLTTSDRAALRTAASTLSTTTAIGTALGLTLSLALATRLRTSRRAIYRKLTSPPTSATAPQLPTALRFANGTEMPVNMAAALKPSRAGDFLTFAVLGLGGVFVGGEAGLAVGTLRARRGVISGEGEGAQGRGERVQEAFRRWRVDVLRREADALEGGREGREVRERVL